MCVCVCVLGHKLPQTGQPTKKPQESSSPALETGCLRPRRGSEIQAGQDLLPPQGPGEAPSCLCCLLGAPGIPGHVAGSLQALPLSPRGLSVPVSLLFCPLRTHLPLGLGPPNPGYIWRSRVDVGLGGHYSLQYSEACFPCNARIAEAGCP